MGKRSPNIAAVVAVAGIVNFDTANATPGTLVLDTAANTVWVVRLNGAVRSLVQVGTGGTPGGLTRTLGVVVTPGGAASGDVQYQCTVLNGDGVPVSLALVFVGITRTLGAGPLTVVGSVGTDVSLAGQGSAEIALVGQCNALGVYTFTVNGTPAEQIDVLCAIDAGAGGSQNLDAARVLP